MTKQPQPQSQRRHGLKPWQVDGLKETLRKEKWGCLIDTKAGHSYGKYEAAAAAGEAMTTILTGHFKNGDRPVHFTMVGSKKANAYAIWRVTFETICLTSRMAQDIGVLATSMAKYLVDEAHADSGFAYIADCKLAAAEKVAALQKLLVQGAVAFLVGHEAGHLSAGHEPVLLAASGAGGKTGSRRKQLGVVLDQFVAPQPGTVGAAAVKRALRLNAHEVDADMQGIALLGTYWALMKTKLHESPATTHTDVFVQTATATPERLLLLASVGVAVALCQFEFDKIGAGWHQQRTHPLTAVRFIVALGALGKFMMDPDQGELLELRPESDEAIEILHQVLARLLLRAAQIQRTATPFEKQLLAASPGVRTQLMLEATGLSTVVRSTATIATFLSRLRAEFDSCAELRKPYIRVDESTLLSWAAVG